jgi:hypothetical protein
MGVMYPPVGHYRTLTWAQKRDRRDAASDLLPQIQWLRGDVRLTSWEEGFLASIARRLQETHGTVSLSPKQWAIIHKLLRLLDEDPPEDQDQDEEQDEDAYAA